MIRKDGGAAFPCHTNPRPDHLADAPQGMSLRDYFAAEAIAEAFKFRQPASGGGGGSFEYVAKIAYQIADAMLAERAK